MTARGYGATPEEWAHFDLVLGLGQDLLPVVSNPTATISPQSKMKGLGKTPSRYNKNRLVAGIADWTSHVTTDKEIAKWSAEPDYGICVATRSVRAIDIDIKEPELARRVHAAIADQLGTHLPARVRANTGKLLLPFTLPGDYAKRVLRVEGGIIEFLATGQQFIACGTHPSGARYEWVGGLPTAIPTLTAEQFEAIWSALEARFAIEPSNTAKISTKAKVLAEAAANDPTAIALYEQNLVIGSEKDGRLHLECPWADEHTDGTGGESSTTYWPANTGGYQQGHFKCLHASHADKTDRDFLDAIGLQDDYRNDFDAITVIDSDDKGTISATRFTPILASDFKAGKPPGWLVKRVLPQAELGVIYGASGSGKSFFALDLVGAVVQGVPWCGRKTRKGVVVYIVAEGASGFRNRINSYCERHGLDHLDLYIIAGAPNFMEAKDIIELTNAIRALGPVALVVVDTLARVSPGANENSGEDMGRVLEHCGTLNKVTGATVLLIHHSGKDEAKGARGWSGIKAALDVEIEITRSDNNRTATVTKMKDGEGEGDQYGFRLDTVPIGLDEDGDTISSCVLEHGAVVAQRAKEKPMGPTEKIVWSVVKDLQGIGTLPSENEVLERAEHSGVKRGNLRRSLFNLVERGKVAFTDSGIAIVSAD